MDYNANNLEGSIFLPIFAEANAESMPLEKLNAAF